MIEYIESLAGLQSLADEWTNIERRFGSPVLSHEWFLAGASAFCPPYLLKIVVRQEDGKVRAIAPLGVRKDLISRLEVLGTTYLTEEGGFLYEDAEALTELVDAVTQLKMPLFLRRLRINSEETRAWEKEIRQKGLKSLVREERLPWTAVRGTWKEFEKEISSSRRSSFRRLQRLIEAKGTLSLEVITPTQENLAMYLDRAFDVEAASWKARKGTAMKNDKRLGDFFREYCKRAVDLKELFLFFLCVDGKPIATELTAIHGNRLWILKIGHDEAWSWCSPGILLMHRVVQYCFDQGLDACEFGGTDEPWLHIWANEYHSAWTYRIYPGSLRGLALLSADFAQLTAKKIATVWSTRKSKKSRSNNA